MPVWVSSLGWALVNSAKRQLVLADGTALPFEAIQEPIYVTPPAFTLKARGIGAPLQMDELTNLSRVWVEPVTTDSILADELRGWYHPRDNRLVENEFGNRFYLDTYGAKWLAFKACYNSGVINYTTTFESGVKK